MTTFEKLGLRAVIFDMDGLLFETEALYLKAWPEVGAAMGFTITQEIAMQTLSRQLKDCEAIFQAHYGPEFSIDAVRPVMQAWFLAEIEKNGLPLRPGAREIVELIHERGIPFALGTANRTDVAQYYLKVTGLAEYFNTIVTLDMVEHAKPAPDVFLQAAERMGVLPAQCLVLEDSPIGLQAAYAAGCLPVLVPDLLTPDEATIAKAWRVFDNLKQVAEVLF
ncbi:MAG: HAD family phosphatase [Oscillospiraceae bacterium]|nr:HAD family phosphatase [Oscillospiraceae bacterium]